MTPLTKISLAIALALIVIAGAAALKKTSSSETAMDLDSTIKAAVVKSLGEDDDTDGLKNWEETLYKTNPSSPDSDEDGVTDGEEVELKRDPTVFGEGTNFATTQDLIPYATSSEQVLSPTEKFSRDLFLKYLEAKQTGTEITDSTVSSIADSVLEKNYSEGIHEFTISPRLVLSDNSTQALKAYANEFGALISVEPVDGIPHETDIWNRIATDGFGQNDAKSLSLITKRYESIRGGLVKIAVPEHMIEGHELVIRGLDRVVRATTITQKFDSDPIGGYIAINKYGEGIDMMTAGIGLLKTELLKGKAVFSPQEPGAVIME